MKTISVTGPRPYDVFLGHNLIGAITSTCQKYRALVIIHQGPVERIANILADSLISHGVAVSCFPIADAESGKTLDSLSKCWDEFARAGLTRSDAVIGLGGGAATDLAGFAAATWMRGIDVIQVPTTVLAMVDAAVGGKTGINTEAGKNLVGAFHEPRAVFVDLDFVRSLPKDEIIAGSAEIVKTGFIADPEIISLYEKDPEGCLLVDGHLPELVYRSIAVKAKVVSEDLKESGLREILNYGHTFGHAIEKAENYSWRHGHAVAVGMCYEAILGRNLGHGDEQLVEQHVSILRSIGLPTTYSDAAFDELLEAMGHDKKNKNGKIRFVLLDGIAKPIRVEGPDEALLSETYRELNESIPTNPMSRN